MNSEKVLELKDITKIYSNTRGVKNINFDVLKGEIVGLLGPNGSGKTTIMKAITGLCGVNSGTIKIFGFNIEDEFEKAMREVGCIIEAPALYENLSAYKNLKLMSRFYSNIDDTKIREVLKLVRLNQYEKDKAGKFSLGMKQRLGIAMAFISNPSLIILDEPANGLDIEGMVEIREIITKMAKESGTTFLISSHLANEIEKTCTRVVVLYEGEIISTATMEEALEFHPTLEDYFLSGIKEKRLGGAVI